MKRVRVGVGAGFSGDRLDAALPLVERGEIGYLVFECLAERTIALAQKDRLRDANRGYHPFLEERLRRVLPACKGRGVKIVSNMGAANPEAAGRRAADVTRELGIDRLKIAVVTGDDVLEIVKQGDYRASETGQPIAELDDVVSANAYLGAGPIREALERGADLVITGRVADAALFLGPLVHHHGWAWDDWDRLAAGTVVGHLLECSGQVTGGNHGGDWQAVPEPWRVGFPLADVEPDGTAVIRKPAGTGGRVDVDTVRQQLLYEVHDPAAYLTPDVVADFTGVGLEELGADRVRVTGARGRAATGSYKVVGAAEDGWLAEASLAFAWPDAEAKALATADLARRRVARAGIAVTEWHQELFGVSALHGPAAVAPDDPPEVLLRLAWACADEEDCGKVARQIVPLALSGPPPGMATGNRARPRPSARLRLHSGLVPRAAVDAGVRVVVEDL